MGEEVVTIILPCCSQAPRDLISNACGLGFSVYLFPSLFHQAAFSLDSAKVITWLKLAAAHSSLRPPFHFGCPSSWKFFTMFLISDS